VGAAGALSLVRGNRGHLGLDVGADVDHTVVRLSGPGHPIVAFADSVRFDAGGQMLREILIHACHPAGLLHGLAGDPMVGVLLSMSPRVKGEHRIDLQQAEEEDQAGAQLNGRHCVQLVIAVSQEKDLPEAQDAGHRLDLALVG